MKKRSVILVLLLLVILFVGCSAQNITPSNSDVLDPASFRQQDRQEHFIELEDRYYYLYDYKVYFSEKDHPVFYLLCNKPDCKHDNSNCNAYAESALGYWDGHLYGAVLLDGEPRIFRMNLDGTEHTKIADLEQPVNPAGTAGGFYRLYVHDGYMYYDVSNIGMNTLFRTELSTGKTEQLLVNLLTGDTEFCDLLRFNGRTLYFLLREQNTQTLYSMDTVTLKAEKILGWPTGISLITMLDNVLYYYSMDDAAFYEYNITTDQRRTCLELDYFGGAANYDEDYIYLTTWDDDEGSNMALSIFDRNYQFIQRIELPGDMNFMYDAQDKLIFTTLPSQKATKYLPKSAIGTGEAELLPIEDPYSYR